MTYYTLIASLPHLPIHFDDVVRPPITRPRLNDRLSLLREDDRKVLGQLSDFITWDRQTMERTDESVARHYNQLRQRIHHPVVHEIIEHRMEVRTIVSALRRRRDGNGPPTGVGSLVRPIQRRWKEPQFGLQRQFPWIDEFNREMLARRAVAAERVLYNCTWTDCIRIASQYTFSFEAVLLYLTRWSIVDRWTSRSRESGRVRFDQLIEETLGEYATLQF